MKSQLAALIGLSLVYVTMSRQAPDPQRPVFRSFTEVVTVTASVLSGRNPIVGLKPSDFILTDNGVRQTVDAVSSEVVPIDLTTVLSVFTLDRRQDFLRALNSAQDVSRLLRPNDRLRVVWIDDQVRGEVVDADYALLESPAVRAWMAARLPGTSAMTGVVHPDGRSGWGAALTDGLFYALAWPIEPDRRHVVVAFLDGYDTQSIVETERLPALAGHSDAVLHAVFWATPSRYGGAGGWNLPRGFSGLDSRAWQDSYQIIDEVVQQTGGTLQRPDSAPEALSSIVEDFRSSYVLRYRPQGVKPGGWHKLDVKIARPGSFKIRARKGYEGG